MRAWSGVAPGLQQTQQWTQWLADPQCPQGEVTVDVSHIPAMTRRRLGPLAKMAVAVADEALQHAHASDIPVVWASRYGDADKSLALLAAQAQGEALSPTAFGLSVHNGVGAQHSILRGMKANAVCVASSHTTPEAGMVEAVGLLHEGAREVLCVVYDAPLPAAYAPVHDEPALSMAWAVLLTRAEAGHPHFTLEAGAALPAESTSQNGSLSLPHALNVLRFLIDPQCRQYVRCHPAGQWVWRRVDA